MSKLSLEEERICGTDKPKENPFDVGERLSERESSNVQIDDPRFTDRENPLG